MTEFVEARWTRYGKDRVYVRTADGADVGYVDLHAGTCVAAVAGFDVALGDCLRRWSLSTVPSTEPVVPAPALPVPSVDVVDPPRVERPPAPPAAPRDLGSNIAGAAAQVKRDEVSSVAPVKNFVARILGVKTDERAWRVGAKGEQMVARELAKLGPGWRVLHAVEVGERGSDIDHIVIGPPGVWTLNAKRHPGATAWIGEHMVMINGQRTQYLRNSRHEAQRAARKLSALCAQPVEVTAAIVFVDLHTFTVKQMPPDLHVTTRLRMVRWLKALPTTTDAETVDAIYTTARLSTTWQ